MDKEEKIANEHKLPKNKIITAAVILVLLAALGLGWYFSRDAVPASVSEEDTNTSAELLNVSITDISSVKVKNGETDITVTVKDGNISISPENSELTPQILENYLGGYTLLYANKEIKDGQNRLQEYGISEDDKYFEITLSDGKKHRFCIGNEITGSYYCFRPEDKTVWLVPASCSIQLLKAPEIAKENSDTFTIAIDYNNIYSVSVAHGQKDILAIKRVSGSTALPNNFYGSYELTKPVADIAYTTEFTDFMKSLSTVITPQGHMGLASENAAKYGIENGYTLVVKDGSKTHTIRFGDRGATGAYMTYNEYPYVYVVSDSLLTVLENIVPTDFITPYIDLYDVNKVKEIVINHGNNKYTFTVDNQNKKYTLNGKKLSEDDFNSIYNALSEITSYKGVEANLTKGEKVCTISYKLIDTSAYTRTYYYCGSSMVYMTTRDSGLDATVKKSTLDSILNKIQKAAK